MPTFAGKIPNDNMYVIKEAGDLPQVVDRWRIYHLLYDPGAGAGLYYSPDAINLVRLASGGATIPAGTVDGSLLRWDTGGGVWLEFTSFILPAADGALDQIMQTDGAGVVSWVDPPSGIADGTILHATLRWDGAAWVENDNILINPAGDIDIQADATTGFVNMDSPIIFGPYSGVTGAVYGFDYDAVENISVGFVGGGLNFSGNITFTNSLFIYESFRGAPTINSAVNPGFAAYTVLQALPQLNAGAGAGFDPLAPVIVNAGASVRNSFVALRTVTGVTGLNFSSTLHGLIAGATMNSTLWTGLLVAPKWNTVAGSIINFGAIIGVNVQSPAQALFASSAGTERMESYIGLQVANPTINNLAGNAPVAAVRSFINAATTKRFLDNLGTAESDFGAGDIHLDAGTWLKMGAGVDDPPYIFGFQGSQGALAFSTFFGVGGNALYLEGNASHEWVFRANSGGLNPIGIGFDVDIVIFGTTAPTPDTNNYFVRFEGPDGREVWQNGVYSDVWWTAGGTVDVNGMTVTELNSYRIDPIVNILNGGTIEDITGLHIAGMGFPGSGLSDRLQSLWISGRSRFDGVMNYLETTLAQLTADEPALALPVTNLGRFMLFQDSDNLGPWDIQGIVVEQPGDSIWIINDGADEYNLTHEDVAAAAADRIITPDGATITLEQNHAVLLWYDPAATRWRVLNVSAGGGGGIADGTTEGSILTWDVGNTAWEEETQVIWHEQVNTIIPGGLTGNTFEIKDDISGRPSLLLSVPGASENLLFYVDDATFRAHINSQNIRVSAPSGTEFLHVARFAYISNNDNLSLSDSVGGKQISTALLGGNLEILAGNGSRDLHLTFGTGLIMAGKASDHTSIPGAGQFWVDSADGLPYFTDDADVIYPLTTSGQTLPSGTVEGEMAFWDDTGGVWDTAPLLRWDVTLEQLEVRDPFLDTNIVSLGWSAAFNPRLDLGSNKAGSAAELAVFNALNIFAASSNTVRIYGGPTTASDHLELQHNGVNARISTGPSDGYIEVLSLNGTDDLRLLFGTGLRIGEKASAHASVATLGQFWVRNDVPNVPMFTDDSGVDYNLLEVQGGSSIIAAYRFDTSIVEADPGNGDLRYDNATPASVTELYISSTTDNGVDLQNILSFIASGDRVYVQQDNDSTKYLLFDVTANVDNGGWFSLAGTVSNSGTIPDSNAKIHILILFGASGGTGVASVTGGTNINITGTAADPVVNLDAAILGVSVNGVTLSNAGAATSYLDETGAYSVPAGAGVTSFEGRVGVVVANALDYADVATIFTTDQTIGGTASLILGDDREIRFGDGFDVLMDYDGTNFIINNTGIGAIQLTGSPVHVRGGEAFAIFDGTNNDNVNWIHNGVDLIVSETGTGAIRHNSINLGFGDSDQLMFGDIDDVEMNWNDATGELQMNFVSATAEFEIRFNGGQGFRTTGGGSTALAYAGVYPLFTAEYFATGNTSGALILGHSGHSHFIGFNDLLPINVDVSDTLEASHAGTMALKETSTARTLTLASNVDLDFPVNAMTTVVNAFTSGLYTVTEGASTTLYVLDGSTRVDSAGGITINPGGVVNIWRRSATVYHCWGIGINP